MLRMGTYEMHYNINLHVCMHVELIMAKLLSSTHIDIIQTRKNYISKCET